ASTITCRSAGESHRAMARASKAAMPGNSSRSRRRLTSAAERPPRRSRRVQERDKVMDRIGFIGLGRMGRPMASNIVRRGFEVSVYDVNPEATAALAEVGAGIAGSIAEVAERSDVVVTMLPSGIEVEQVVTGS